MSPVLVLMAGLFGVSVVAALVARIFAVKMIAALNRRRPKHDQISYVSLAAPKQIRISREYRREYPDGRLHWYEWVCFGIALLAFAILVAMMAAITLEKIPS